MGSRCSWTFTLCDFYSVSYIPGEVESGEAQNMISYENRGYDYFATTNNPVLARVVQYATLHQIFHKLGVGEPREKVPSRNAPEVVFRTAMEAFWTKVNKLNEPTFIKDVAPTPFDLRWT